MPLARAALAVFAALAALPPAAPGATGWHWPVSGPVLTSFRVGPDPFAAGQRRGIRIGAPRGTAVRSACDGRVRFAGPAGTSGRTLSVTCGRYTATYLHLAALEVDEGERVEVGERIARVGTSGRPRIAEPHLAFGVRVTGRRWAYVDPLSLLPGASRPPPAPVSPPRLRVPRLGPAPPASPQRAPRGAPLPRAGERTPREAPLPQAGERTPRGVPLPRVGERAPRGVPLPRAGERTPRGVPLPRVGERAPDAALPLAVWVGLGAVAAALAAWPVRVVRRRRRALGARVVRSVAGG